MQATMMDVPLSLNHLLERAGTLFRSHEIVSRLPDKTLRRHSYGEYHRRTRKRSSASCAIQPISSGARRRFSVCITPPAAGMPK